MTDQELVNSFRAQSEIMKKLNDFIYEVAKRLGQKVFELEERVEKLEKGDSYGKTVSDDKTV